MPASASGFTCPRGLQSPGQADKQYFEPMLEMTDLTSHIMTILHKSSLLRERSLFMAGGGGGGGGQRWPIFLAYFFGGSIFL